MRNQLLAQLISGDFSPGQRLVERTLAKKLGVSRVPVREALTQLVARGLLVHDEGRGGVCLRQHTPEDVMELFELREAIETAAARSACQRATSGELLRLEMICDQMDSEVGNYGSQAWAELERNFHEQLVAASHNRRFIHNFDLLISETYYLFYLYPARELRKTPTKEWIHTHMAEVVQDHRQIVALLQARDEDGIQNLVRAQMQKSVRSISRAMVERELAKLKTKNANVPKKPSASR